MRYFPLLWRGCASSFSITAPSLTPYPCVLPSDNPPFQRPVSFWGESKEIELLLQCSASLPITDLTLFSNYHWASAVISPWLLDLLCASPGRYVPGNNAELYLPLNKLKVNFPLVQRLFQRFKSSPSCFVCPAFIISSAKCPSVRPLRAAVCVCGYPASWGGSNHPAAAPAK